jgi:hypothetical protein
MEVIIATILTSPKAKDVFDVVSNQRLVHG